MALRVTGNVQFGPLEQPTLIEAITTAGLTSNLQYALDAGDTNSYSGTGQSWLDTAGNGQDFFRGNDGTAETTDPTFNGTADGKSSSEYWSFDGGDYFKYDSALTTMMSSAHLNNAAFTLIMVARFGAVDESNVAVGSREPDPGIIWGVNGSSFNNFVVRASGSTPLSVAGDDTLVNDTIYFLAISVDESVGAGGGFMYRDGAFNQVSASNTFDSTYTSPGGTAGHWAFGRSGVNPEISTGSRVYMTAAWDTALTKANLDSLFAEVKDRFGL